MDRQISIDRSTTDTAIIARTGISLAAGVGLAILVAIPTSLSQTGAAHDPMVSVSEPEKAPEAKSLETSDADSEENEESDTEANASEDTNDLTALIVPCAADDMECEYALGRQAFPYTAENPGPEKTYWFGQKPVVMTAFEAERQRRCIAIAAYGEARGDSLKGILAVMWSIKNRTADPKYPSTPCEVIVQRAAFEPMSKPAFRAQKRAAKNGEMIPALRVKNVVDRAKLTLIQLTAFHMLNGSVKDDPTDGATHFWAPQAQQAMGRDAPAWAAKMVQTAAIDKHVFYRAH